MKKILGLFLVSSLISVNIYSMGISSNPNGDGTSGFYVNTIFVPIRDKSGDLIERDDPVLIEGTTNILEPDSEKVKIIVDDSNDNTSRTGKWYKSSGRSPYAVGSIYSNEKSTFRFLPSITKAGDYKVSYWSTYHKNRSENVPFTVVHNDTKDVVSVNMRDAELSGKWVLLGTYDFNENSESYIELSTENGQACADAVKLERIVD